MSTYIFVAQVSIPDAYRETFEDLYEREHIRYLLAVPGVRSAKRYQLEWSTPQMAEYLTIYEVDHPDIPKSEAWKAAANKGEWGVKVRPYYTLRLHGMYKAVESAR